MIADIWLRLLVTGLFLLSAAQCVYALVTAREDRAWADQTSRALHLVMAVAMLVMAWPAGMGVPNRPPLVFFLLAAAWFAVVLVVRSGHRVADGYHAVMMLAMAWMYAVMSGGLTAKAPDGVDASAASGGHANMPGMAGMPGMATPDADSAAALANPPFVSGLNWMFTVGFAVATGWWLYRYFGQRKADPAQPAHRFLGVVAQAMMAAGMAIMFGVML